MEAGNTSPTEPEQHNQSVLDYFVATGIPKAQVAGANALTLLAAGGEVVTDRPPQAKVIGYQSALRRSVDGVLIAESVAWARITPQGEVLSEGLYWPAIPGRVVAEAKRFREQLQNARAREEFSATLPPSLPEGHVVIHHSSAMDREKFEAFASYDVMAPVHGADYPKRWRQPITWVARHFDINGKEIRLSYERRPHTAEPERRQAQAK